MTINLRVQRERERLKLFACWRMFEKFGYKRGRVVRRDQKEGRRERERKLRRRRGWVAQLQLVKFSYCGRGGRVTA